VADDSGLEMMRWMVCRGLCLQGSEGRERLTGKKNLKVLSLMKDVPEEKGLPDLYVLHLCLARQATEFFRGYVKEG
jgi:hypothetical protein